MTYRVIFLGLLCFVGISCFAQSSFVTVNLNSVFLATGSADAPVLRKNSQRIFYVLPSVGYYYKGKKDWGMGGEFGVNFQKYTDRSYFENEFVYSFHEYKIKENSYFLSLSCFRDIFINKFYISLPLTLRFVDVYKKELIDDILSGSFPGNTNVVSYNYYRYPNMYSLSLNFVPGIYRQVYNRFYMGLRLLAGVELIHHRGKDYSFQQRSVNGGNPESISIRDSINFYQLNWRSLQFSISGVYFFKNK